MLINLGTMLPLTLVHSRPVVATALLAAALLCCVEPASAASKSSGKSKDKGKKGSSGSTSSGTVQTSGGTLTVGSGSTGSSSSGVVKSSGGALTIGGGSTRTSTSGSGSGIVSSGSGGLVISNRGTSVVSLPPTTATIRTVPLAPSRPPNAASLTSSSTLTAPALATGITAPGNTSSQGIVQTWGSGNIGQGLLASTFNTPPVNFNLVTTNTTSLTLAPPSGVSLGTLSLTTAQGMPVIGSGSSTLAASLPIGAVPEPGVAGLLMLGMSFVGLRRRRR